MAKRTYTGIVWADSLGSAIEGSSTKIPMVVEEYIAATVYLKGKYQQTPEPYSRDISHWAPFQVVLTVDTEEPERKTGWEKYGEMFEEVS